MLVTDARDDSPVVAKVWRVMWWEGEPPRRHAKYVATEDRAIELVEEINGDSSKRLGSCNEVPVTQSDFDACAMIVRARKAEWLDHMFQPPAAEGRDGE